jgi:hypothetical protein
MRQKYLFKKIACYSIPMETVGKCVNTNIGLSEIDKLLVSRGWERSQEESGEFRYKRDPTTQDEYVIRLTDKHIVIAVPLPNSEFLFATKFNSYFQAAEFIEMHLDMDEERRRNFPCKK